MARAEPTSGNRFSVLPITEEEERDYNYMSDDSSASSNDSDNQVSRKVAKEDFWSKKIKAENPFGRGRQKSRRNHHISYLQKEVKCPNEILGVDECNNAPVCNDETLLQFRNFGVVDEDTSKITFKSVAGHVLQITADALMGAIDTLFYAPKVWCT